MARTDDLAGAIRVALESHRAELDGDGDLRAVFVTVRLDERDGGVRSVVLNRESEPLRRRPRGEVVRPSTEQARAAR